MLIWHTCITTLRFFRCWAWILEEPDKVIQTCCHSSAPTYFCKSRCKCHCFPITYLCNLSLKLPIVHPGWKSVLINSSLRVTPALTPISLLLLLGRKSDCSTSLFQTMSSLASNLGFKKAWAASHNHPWQQCCCVTQWVVLFYCLFRFDFGSVVLTSKCTCSST